MIPGQHLISFVYSAFFIIVGIMGIGFLIGFHELGHFIFCKIFHIRTPSFSIGMGPRIVKKKIGETEFALSLLPLGGYVEIAGSAEVGQGDQKEAKAVDEGSFAVKPYYQKMLVMAGGILFNFLFAYFALSALYYMGMPKTPLLYPLHASSVISTIEPETPAAQYKLQPNDKILAIDNKPVHNASEIIAFIKDLPNKSAQFLVERNGEQKTVKVTLGSREVNKATSGFLGVEFAIPRFGLIESIKNGITATNYLISHIVGAFKNIFVAREFDNLGGPLMVISQTIKGAERGFKIFLLLLAFISINLAILNIIPLPIMDGGQALFYTIEAIMRRPLNEKVREYIHYATWILLLILVVYLSIKDVITIFGLKEVYLKLATKIKDLF